MNKISRRSFVPMLGTALVGASCLSLQEKNPLQLIPQDTILPKRLKKGDTIGVCAPAGGIKDASEISAFKSVLESFGFKVLFSEHVDGRHGYFSGTDEERAGDFMTLIENPDVNAIFFIRGGWGCARILEYLDFEAIKSNPKIIMGFSDITTLLNIISAKTGLITFHGPGGNSSWNEFSRNSIVKLLMDAEKSVYAPESLTKNSLLKTIVGGKANGEFYGGNLSVMSDILGSEGMPDWNGKILFLEDVMEEPYRIDRMLTHLKLNGIFDQVNGIVLGQFRKCIAEEQDRTFTIEEVFEQHFGELNKPVFSGAAIGHIKYKHTVPVGMNVTIDADAKTIELAHPAVS